MSSLSPARHQHCGLKITNQNTFVFFNERTIIARSGVLISFQMGNDVSTVPLDFARILLNVNTNCLDSDNMRTKHFISTELDGETIIRTRTEYLSAV